MTSVTAGLLPNSQGIQFTARPALRTRECLASSNGHHRNSLLNSARSVGSSLGSALTSAAPNTKLSSIEVEAHLREKVKAKYESLQQAFQTYDIDQVLSITKGEFRRVLESFCMPLTTEQFEAVLAKIDKNNNGTVKYCDFLDKFQSKGVTVSGQDRWMAGKHGFIQQPNPGESNVDMVEKMLKQKVNKNMKQVVKALRLFDYNRDGKIQRHEMRRVLENFCFKFTDSQFEKLWQRYDFHHSGVVDYMDFLRKLGVIVDKGDNVPPRKETNCAMSSSQMEEKRNDDLRRRVILQSNLVLKGLNFDQIEFEFRKMMKKSYVPIKKACMAMDGHLDGWLRLEDLKSILDQFTMPMSDQLFTQLMARFEIKASDKVKWEFFLSKFQDPQSVGNGQTIPIKPNHKWFPIRGGNEAVDAGTIWKLLYSHVHNNNTSFKSAFLQYDTNRNGFVSRKELKKIIEKFTIRLTDDQFKSLMTHIDPDHTNKVSYHDFLELFEERETMEGHKWLKSCHRFNEHQKPVIMAWETVEDILREKITENWKAFSDTLVQYDPKSECLVLPKQLRKAIDQHILPVSNDHFEHMVSRLSDRREGKVNYVEFLELLQVDVIPGDVIGLSSQIQDGSLLTEQRRLKDQLARHARMDECSMNRTSCMSAEEVITRLKDRMSQHDCQIRQSFLSYALNRQVKISKKNFRQMLATCDMFMTDDQFKELISKLSFQKNYLTYTDFVASFDDPRSGGPGEDIQRTDNHRVNPIRGDEYGMTALEAESKLRSKLRENFSDLRGAFYKFDDDHNGLLTKENFRRLLDAFMILVSDHEFEKLSTRLGLDKRSHFSYQDFLERFEVRDTVDGHQWLNSVHRFNVTKPISYMTAETVHGILGDKCHRQWRDLAKAFLSVDQDGNGIITRKELRQLLYRFILPVTRDEFTRLWAMYDVEGKGYVSHHDFLEKVGASSSYAPGDGAGVSRAIIEQSAKTLDNHHQDQQNKHERITLHQAQTAAGMTAQHVHRQLKDKIRDSYSDLYAAFRMYDTKKKGTVSVQEVQKLLVGQNYFISDQQFFELLDLLGLSTKNSKLNYGDFLKAFEDGRKSSYGQREADVRILEFDSLSPEEAERKLRDKVAVEYDLLKKALLAFDKQQTGKIAVADFRRILDLFCFKMTDAQFKFILNRVYTGTDNLVSYFNFLDQYKLNEQEDAEKWLMASVQPSAQATSSQLMSVEEIQERLRESVAAHFYTIARECAETDYAKIGVLCKQDFREVIAKHVFRLTDFQFEELWAMLPVNVFGNLEYRQFLKLYSSDVTEPLLTRSAMSPVLAEVPAKRPRSAMSRSHTMSRMGMARPMTMASRAASRMGTPLVNAAAVERNIKRKIYTHWKAIQKQCRERDTDNSGSISIYDFRDILMNHGIETSGEEFHKLAIKYDRQDCGQFCYVEFLRHFVLTLKPKDDHGKLQRKKIPAAKLQVETGDCSDPFFDVMLRLRECVVKNWKEMRRSFRGVDPTATGTVGPLDFRRILKHYNINLSEDEFFQLLCYYDTTMEGNVSYNDFIRAYLKES